LPGGVESIADVLGQNRRTRTDSTHETQTRDRLNPITHFLTEWSVANTIPSLDLRDRTLITRAGVVPDRDGLGAIPDMLPKSSVHPLEWFSLHYHQLHNLALGFRVTGLVYALARHKWVVGLLALLSFHLHLREDIAGGRGPDGYPWPIPYWKPFSDAGQFAWSRQWALNAWQNFVITFVLMLIMSYLAWSGGYSPLEMVSARADHAFVETLRRRFPKNLDPTTETLGNDPRIPRRE
jgi:inner membrane protein